MTTNPFAGLDQLVAGGDPAAPAPKELTDRAGVPQSIVESYNKGAADLAALKEDRLPPSEPLWSFRRLGDAIGNFPVMGTVAKSAWWWLTKGSPGFAEMVGDRALHAFDPKATAVTKAWDDAWKSSNGNIGAALEAVAKYREEREDVFWGEKFLGELLIDPLNLLGWGLAGKLAHGGAKGTLAALRTAPTGWRATQPGATAVKALEGLDAVDQLWIAATNAPFRATAGIYNHLPWRTAAATQRLFRDGVNATVQAGTGAEGVDEVVGATGRFITSTRAKTNPTLAETNIQHAAAFIEMAAPDGAADFWRALDTVSATEGNRLLLEKLGEVQALNYKLARTDPAALHKVTRDMLERTAKAAGLDDVTATALSKKPLREALDELRLTATDDVSLHELDNIEVAATLWTRDSVRKLMPEVLGRFADNFDPQLSRSGGAKLMKLYQMYPSSMLATASYGPFNILEDALRAVSGGSDVGLRSASTMRYMVAGSEGALSTLRQVPVVVDRSDLSTVVAAAKRSGMSADETAQVFTSLEVEKTPMLQGQAAPGDVNPLTLTTGNKRIDDKTKFLGQWSVDWGSRLGSQLRRNFLLNRTLEGFSKEIARNNLVGQHPSIQALVDTISDPTVLKHINKKTRDNLFELAIMSMDSSPELTRAIFSRVTAPQLRADKLADKLSHNTWLPTDVKEGLLRELPNLTPAQLDDAIDRLVRKPMEERYALAAENATAIIDVVQKRLDDATPASASEALSLLNEAMDALTATGGVPSTLQHLARSRAARAGTNRTAKVAIYREADEAGAAYVRDTAAKRAAMLTTLLTKVEPLLAGNKQALGAVRDYVGYAKKAAETHFRQYETWLPVKEKFWDDHLDILKNGTPGDVHKVYADYTKLQQQYWGEGSTYKRLVAEYETGGARRVEDALSAMRNAGLPPDAAARAAAERAATDEASRLARERLMTSDEWLGVESDIAKLRGEVMGFYREAPVDDAEYAIISKWLADIQQAQGALTTEARQALNVAKGVGMRDAAIAYKMEYTNYLDEMVPDAFLKSLFPFWSYASQRLPWLARQLVQKPLYGKAFAPEDGVYYRHTEDGYLPVSIGGFGINLTQGNVFGVLHRAYNNPDQRQFDGLYGGIDSIVRGAERFGFWTNPLAKGVLDLAGNVAQDSESDLKVKRIAQAINEQLPPVWSLFTEAASGVIALGKEAASADIDITKLLTDGNRHSPYDANAVAKVLESFGGLFDDRWREAYARKVGYEKGIPWSRMTPQQKASAEAEASFRRLLTTFLGAGTFKPEEQRQYNEALKAAIIKAVNEAAPSLQWDEAKYDRWQELGYSWASLPVADDVHDRINDMKATQIAMEVSLPLKPDSAQRALETTNQIWKQYEVLKQTLKIEEMQAWEARKAGEISGQDLKNILQNAARQRRTFISDAKKLEGGGFLVTGADKQAFREQLGLETYFQSPTDFAVQLYYSIPVEVDPISGDPDYGAVTIERQAVLDMTRKTWGDEVYNQALLRINGDTSTVSGHYWNGWKTYMQPYYRSYQAPYTSEFINYVRQTEGHMTADTLTQLLPQYQDLKLEANKQRFNLLQAPRELKFIEQRIDSYQQHLRATNPDVDQWLMWFNDR